MPARSANKMPKASDAGAAASSGDSGASALEARILGHLGIDSIPEMVVHGGEVAEVFSDEECHALKMHELKFAEEDEPDKVGCAADVGRAIILQERRFPGRVISSNRPLPEVEGLEYT